MDPSRVKRVGEKEYRTCKLLEECKKEIDSIIDRTGIEEERLVLTSDAVNLHDSIEKAMSSLREVVEKSRGEDSKLFPMSSLETALPDLVVAVVLLIEEPRELLGNARKNVIDLRDILLGSKVKLASRLKKWFSGSKELLGEFSSQLEGLRNSYSSSSGKHPWVERRDFLSQQIDERSHQIWMLGSLFVPVSFLIFAYAMTIYAVTGAGVSFLFVDPLGKLLLMFASFTCYLTWFTMYLRTNRLNRLSYPLIHALEISTGMHGHLSLNEFRKPSRLIRITREVFLVTLNVLATLWTILLLTSLLGLPASRLFVASVAFIVTCVSLSIALPLANVTGWKITWITLSVSGIVLMSFLSISSDIMLSVGSLLFIGLTLVFGSVLLGMSVLLVESVVRVFRDPRFRSYLCRRNKKDQGDQKQKRQQTEPREK